MTSSTPGGELRKADISGTVLEEHVNKKSYSYLAQMQTFTIMDYLRDHILLVLFAVTLLVAGLITLIGYRISIRKLEV